MAGQSGSRREGLSATIYVLLAILALAVIVGVIIWMVKAGPSVEHSPQRSQHIESPGFLTAPLIIPDGSLSIPVHV